MIDKDFIIKKDGVLMKKFKNLIRKVISNRGISRIQYFMSFIHYKDFKEIKNSKKIIHILTPIHGNMGDQAIVYATNRYLKDQFSGYEILEIYKKDIYKYAKALKKVVNNDDLIILIGGGNMGNLWIKEERDRRFVMKLFANNKIISMPQTISFTNDEEGEKEFNKSKDVYNRHKKLTIIAREKKSYEIMKNNFSNANVIINPDVVLYLYNDYDVRDNNRNVIMTCLRDDKESIIGSDKDILINKLNIEYRNIDEYDTVINKFITKEIRENELKKMFDKFLKAKVVITDRLHGMVFCVITKTPCIVTKSLDHKVTGTYEWIKDLNYIKLVDNLDFKNIKPLIDELQELDRYTKIDLNTKYFDNLKEKII